MIALEDVLHLLAERRHQQLNTLQLLYGDLALQDYIALKNHLNDIVHALREEQKLYRLGDDMLTYTFIRRSSATRPYRFYWYVAEGISLPSAWSSEIREAFTTLLDDLESVMPRSASHDTQHTMTVHFLNPNGRFTIQIDVTVDRAFLSTIGWESFVRAGASQLQKLQDAGCVIQTEQIDNAFLWSIAL